MIEYYCELFVSLRLVCSDRRSAPLPRSRAVFLFVDLTAIADVDNGSGNADESFEF